MQNSQGSKIGMSNLAEKIKKFFGERFSNLSSETIGWVGILFLHGATVPSLLALMTGLTGTPPPVDVVLMVWTGLLLFFIKAAVQKDMLNIITIGVGFMIQAIMMMLIFFK
jgi:hypothetical protein